jgi:hypothetical protein
MKLKAKLMKLGEYLVRLKSKIFFDFNLYFTIGGENNVTQT